MKFSSWRRDLVGTIAVGGFVTVCVIVLSGSGVMDVSMKDVGLILVGQLAAKFSTVVDYHYGSSEGSARKDQIAADKSAPTP